MAVAAAALLVVERTGDGTGRGMTDLPASAPGAPVTATRPTPPAAPGPGTPPPAVSAPQELVVLPGPPPVPVDVRARVDAQATAEVDLLREVVRRDCRAQIAGSAPIALTVDLSFDASGREAGRSIIGSGSLPLALRTCVLLASAGQLRVDAPGVPVGARARMELP